VELRCDPLAGEESASMFYEVYSVSDFSFHHAWELSRMEAITDGSYHALKHA